MKDEGYHTVGLSQNPWVSKISNLHKGFDEFFVADDINYLTFRKMNLNNDENIMRNLEALGCL